MSKCIFVFMGAALLALNIAAAPSASARDKISIQAPETAAAGKIELAQNKAQKEANKKAAPLIKEGMELYRAKNYESALRRFTHATEIAPGNGGAWLMRGMMENRLGDFGAALISLSWARELDIVAARIYFEFGWAALRIGDWRSAVVNLEAYERMKPGEAKTMELLGRAELGMGKLSEAEGRLKEALARDASLKPTVLLYLSKLEAKRGNSAAAGEYLARLQSETPDSPVARSVGTRIAQIKKKQTRRSKKGRKAWDLTAGLMYGYNNNVVAVPGSMALPTDITSAQSHMGTLFLNGGYRWDLGNGDSVRPSYSFRGAEYTNTESVDYNSHLLAVDYTHPITSKVSSGGRLAYERLNVSGEGIYAKIIVRPSMTWRIFDPLTLRGFYQFSNTNFFNGGSAVSERDNRSHIGGVTAFLTFTPSARARLGISGGMINSEGTDYMYHTIGVNGGFNLDAAFKTNLDAAFSYADNSFTRLNSLAFRGGLGSQFKRNDERLTLKFRLKRPLDLAPRVFVFAEFAHLKNKSNITFFDYNQQSWNLGLMTSF